MKLVLVTGGAGFIGSHIVEGLVRQGRKVRVLDNFSAGNMEFLKAVRADIQVIRGDVRKTQDCLKAARGVDIVFHQAALRSVAKSVANPIYTHDVDAGGTLHMLEAAKRRKVRRFVNASSSSVYGDARHFPAKESDALDAISPYGIAKLAAEKYTYSYFLNYGLETVSLRYFNVYGPRQSPESIFSNVVPGFIYRFKSGKPPRIFGDGKQSRDFVYVEDVADANVCAAQTPKAKGMIFNVGAGRDTSIIRIYDELARIMGKTHMKPLFQARRPSDPDRTKADITLAKKILSWAPRVQLREGLKKSVEWFG